MEIALLFFYNIFTSHGGEVISFVQGALTPASQQRPRYRLFLGPGSGQHSTVPTSEKPAEFFYALYFGHTVSIPHLQAFSAKEAD